MTSAVLAGACLAAGFGGWLADRFGRPFVMLDPALLFIIGALLSAFAGSVDALLVGRFLIGMCIGVVSFVAPLYIAEIAPPRHRGKLVSLNQLAITIGILVSHIVDTAYAAEGNWRWMLGLGAVPGILLAIGMAYLPESPRWLLKCRRETEAANVLTRFTAVRMSLPRLPISKPISRWSATLSAGGGFWGRRSGVLCCWAPKTLLCFRTGARGHAIGPGVVSQAEARRRRGRRRYPFRQVVAQRRPGASGDQGICAEIAELE